MVGATHYSQEAEQAVLGAMMLSPAALEEGLAALHPDDFYQPRHSVIFESMARLERAGVPVDPISVSGDLQREGQLGKLGGAVFLHDLMSTAGIASNISHYIEIVIDTRNRRKLVEIGLQIQALADKPHDSAILIENARALVDAPRAQRKATTLAELMPRVIDSIESGAISGKSVPWRAMNDLINGLQPGKVYVFGARPAVGKTLIGQALATWFSEKHGLATYFSSLEMPSDELGIRLLASRSGVGQTKLVKNLLSEPEWRQVATATDWIQRQKIVICDEPTQTVNTIRAGARTLARKEPLGLIVVDYLTLVTPDDPRAPREQQVAEMSRAFKRLAKELSVPVVILAQLNRQTAYRADPTPLMTDLRESGAIEADADVVGLLHRPDNDWRLVVIITKNRGGEQGEVELVLNGAVARIDSPAREH